MTGFRSCTLIAVLELACVVGTPEAAGPRDATPPPVTVDTSTVGRFSEGFSWRLRVDGLGTATLSIDTWPKPTVRHFNVPAQELAALRAVVERERFFLLADEYGQDVPDGSTTKIGVTVGGREKVVTIRYLMNWVYSDPKRLQEPARALRVLQVIRRWFTDDEAVDLSKYDAMVIEAASGPTRS